MSMEKDSARENGWEYNVIDEAGLLTATRNEGWELVETVVQDSPMSVNRTLVVGNPPYTLSAYDQEVGRITRYLLRRRCDSPVAAALARANEATKRADDADRARKKVLDEKHMTDGTIVHLQHEVESGRTYAGTLNDDLKAERERNQRLERDIAKIRKALGEIRMKEILGT